MPAIKLVTPTTLPTEYAAWFTETNFNGEAEQVCRAPDGTVFAGVENPDALHIWSLAHLPKKLKTGNYTLAQSVDKDTATQLLLGWELAKYAYNKDVLAATLSIENADLDKVTTLKTAIYRARDLVNTPPNILTPVALGDTIKKVAKAHKASIKSYSGKELLIKNFPLVHAVGRASDNEPCLVDVKWGDKKHPKITLVGKGVTFDSGGLDTKSPTGMRLMKKDMGGAAQTLALAECIMALKLPIQLRVLIPCVENSINGNAFRVSDVITARNGTSVEIGNTDAEGRLILADAISAAAEENPELIIDCATLTGAARVAVGTDIAAFFCNHSKTTENFKAAADKWHDPVWQLPLHQPYRSKLKVAAADISSTGTGGHGGAITAALFLEHFVGQHIPWLHLDFMAWRLSALPGRPKGGDVMGLLGALELLSTHYSPN